MQIFKTAVPIVGSSKVFLMDTICWQEQYWLVPVWIEHPDEEKMQPERIILLDSLLHEKTDDPLIDFVLRKPIPKDVLDGLDPLQTAFPIVEVPEIFLDIPSID